ncbi:hypothetical protein Q3G72_015507 [Acer saccharum]|nr:hypothetical protein Q3G72_015507 [Acer saccharum]
MASGQLCRTRKQARQSLIPKTSSVSSQQQLKRSCHRALGADGRGDIAKQGLELCAQGADGCSNRSTNQSGNKAVLNRCCGFFVMPKAPFSQFSLQWQALGRAFLEKRATGLRPHAESLLCKRWTTLIVDVLLRHPRRFNELLSEMEVVSDRMLSERLKELEQAGVVLRRILPNTPLRVEYSLTGKGRDLAPIIDAIRVWSERYRETNTAQTAPAAVDDPSNPKNAVQPLQAAIDTQVP